MFFVFLYRSCTGGIYGASLLADINPCVGKNVQLLNSVVFIDRHIERAWEIDWERDRRYYKICTCLFYLSTNILRMKNIF